MQGSDIIESQTSVWDRKRFIAMWTKPSKEHVLQTFEYSMFVKSLKQHVSLFFVPLLQYCTVEARGIYTGLQRYAVYRMQCFKNPGILIPISWELHSESLYLPSHRLSCFVLSQVDAFGISATPKLRSSRPRVQYVEGSQPSVTDRRVENARHEHQAAGPFRSILLLVHITHPSLGLSITSLVLVFRHGRRKSHYG